MLTSDKCLGKSIEKKSKTGRNFSVISCTEKDIYSGEKDKGNEEIETPAIRNNFGLRKFFIFRL